MAHKAELPLSIDTVSLEPIEEQTASSPSKSKLRFKKLPGISHNKSASDTLRKISTNSPQSIKPNRSRSYTVHTNHTVHHSLMMNNRYIGDDVHPLHTIDDMALLETVRDVIDEHQESKPLMSPKAVQHQYAKSTSPKPSHRQKFLKRLSGNRKLTYIDKYGDLVFSALSIDKSCPNLKRRVSAIIKEIESQDSFGHDEDFEEDEKDNNEDVDENKSDNFEEDLISPSAEQKRRNVVEKEMNSPKYKELKNKYNAKMNKMLPFVSDKKKAKKELYNQCNSFSHEIGGCQALKRLVVLMEAHRDIMDDDSLWHVVPIQPLIGGNDIYDYQQVVNDFLHIKFHIERDKKAASTICSIFNVKIKCNNLAKCRSFQRHYRDRTDITEQRRIYFRRALNDTSKRSEIMNNKDIVFQQECDKIHSFLLHSLIGFEDKNEEESNERMEEIGQQAKGRSFTVSPPNSALNTPIYSKSQSPEPDFPNTDINTSLTYIGKQEDEEWWKQIDTISDDKDDADMDDAGYKLLAQKMGVFRYQSSHGFRTGQYHGLSHLKAHFANVKEEALQNEFHCIQNDDWNQTLRKAKAFYNSWNKARIRSQYDGAYNDQISGHTVKWKNGEEIRMSEVVILKLYTDFDKLQFELKKCFRWETIFDLFSHIDQEKMDEKMNENELNNEKDKKQELKKRLCQFFHWRLGLLALLNKFGQQMRTSSDDKLELYHGVNAKMILNPAETLAFSGPLSTTSSYHVAQTFATKKGMVLKITSQFPRLNKCRAFDVSPLSDYPEEQEYLIGDIYLRLLQVSTRTLMTSWDDFDKLKNVPLASFTRAVFFVIHVFREQIFSMSENLENFLAMFLELHLQKNGFDKYMKRNKDQLQSQKHGIWLGKQIDGVHKNKKIVNDNDRRRKILKILWKKFNQFRLDPNMKQIIKIDRVSDKLKAYFFDDLGAVNIKTNKPRYAVSFEKIINIFENVREIHFINDYKLDDTIVRKLVKQIKKEDNKLKCVRFLYYDYKNNKDKNARSRPEDSNKFVNPEHIVGSLAELSENGWKVRPKANGKVGYKINIFAARVIDPKFD